MKSSNEQDEIVGYMGFTNTARGRRGTIPSLVADMLHSIVAADPSIKPAKAVQQLREAVLRTAAISAAEFPPERTLRTKVSSIKAALKRTEKAILI